MEGLTIASFFEAWELFRTATLTGTIAGALLGFLGVYVVLRRLVFLTAATSQAAGLGVVFAFYLQIHVGIPAAIASPTLGAAVVTLLAALPFALEVDAKRQDGLLGVVYLVGAAGVLALGTRIVQELADVQSLLFGTAVAVVDDDFHLVAWTSAILLALHVWLWRGFTMASFDPAGARVRGLPVRTLDLALFGSLALAVSVATRVIGALPTFAFSVLPAMAAVRVGKNLAQSLLLATVIGAVAGFAGYVGAYLYEIPVGAAQTLVAAIFVAFTALLKAIRGR